MQGLQTWGILSARSENLSGAVVTFGKEMVVDMPLGKRRGLHHLHKVKYFHTYLWMLSRECNDTGRHVMRVIYLEG